MSLVQSLTTTPEGLAIIGAVLGALGLGKVQRSATDKIRRLVGLAERLIRRAKSEPALAALIAKDPDAALEAAIVRAAAAAGVTVNARELRRAVGELVLLQVLEDGQEQLVGLREELERMERVLEGKERPRMQPKTWRDR